MVIGLLGGWEEEEPEGDAVGSGFGEVDGTAVSFEGGNVGLTTPTSSLSVAVLFWLLLLLKDITKPVAAPAMISATMISHSSRFRRESSALSILPEDGESSCSSSSSVSYDNWASLSFSIVGSRNLFGSKCEISLHYQPVVELRNNRNES